MLIIHFLDKYKGDGGGDQTLFTEAIEEGVRSEASEMSKTETL